MGKIEITGNPTIRAKWHTGDGVSAEGQDAIFPICTLDKTGLLAFIGTAFFICTNGVFVTAKHVLLNNRGENLVEPLYGIHFLGESIYVLRPVMQVCIDNLSDVAVGVLAIATNNETGELLTNKILILTDEIPDVGEIATTFAYPKTQVKDVNSIRELHFETSWHCGFVLNYLPEGRDRVMLPGPCYRTTIEILHGASGGPVMNTKARVFAVNSTGFDGLLETSRFPESYVSAIQSLFSLKLDDVALSPNLAPRSVNVSELIDLGHLVIH